MKEIIELGITIEQYYLFLSIIDDFCEFKELFVNLRIEDKRVSLDDLFKSLIKDIELLIERDYVRVMNIEYKTIDKKVLSKSDSMEVIQNPEIWVNDSKDMDDSYVLSGTENGERLFKKIVKILESRENTG